MGNDPFENSSYKDPGQAVTKGKLPEEQTVTIKEESAFKYVDDASQIIMKLDLAERNIASQKDEITALRRELDELKKRVNSSKDDLFQFWLRFWFPWSSR